MLCDLHTHSTFSDGTLTPTQIVVEAKRLGLGAVALCDHNTAKGLDEFLYAGKAFNIITVPAAEFSCEYNGKEVHIISMFISEKHFAATESFTDNYKRLKEESNIKLITCLCENGFEISLEELKNKYGNNLNRAHVAAMLTEKGYFKTNSQAFEAVLSPSKGFYEPPKKPSAFEVLNFIDSISAVSVLAHPFLSLSVAELENFLPKAKAYGLKAIETEYSLFGKETTKKATALAKKFMLAQSGGSDFHGQNKPDISLGSGKGDLKVPFEFYEKLKLIRNYSGQ